MSLPLETEPRARNELLVASRGISGQSRRVNHEVEVVVGASEERVRLTRLDDESVAFVQLDRLALDAN